MSFFKRSTLKLFLFSLSLCCVSGCGTVKYSKLNPRNNDYDKAIGFNDILERHKEVVVLTYEGMGATASEGKGLFCNVVEMFCRQYRIADCPSTEGNSVRLSQKGKDVVIRNSQWHAGRSHYSDNLKRIDDIFGDIHQKHRKKLPKKLKDSFIHNKLIDVLLWRSPVRDKILEVTMEEIRTLNEKHEGAAIVAVTSSLGSDILFQTLEEMKQLGGKDASIASDVRQRLSLIHMWANQLAFLNIADDPSHITSFEIFLKTIKEDKMNLFNPFRMDESHWIVAISDPNDILTYPIPEKFYSDHPGVFLDVHVAIAKRFFWIPILGGVVDPLKAHIGHSESEFVENTFFHGYNVSCK